MYVEIHQNYLFKYFAKSLTQSRNLSITLEHYNDTNNTIDKMYLIFSSSASERITHERQKWKEQLLCELN